MSACTYGTIWKNKHRTTKSQMKIYKTAVRHILTYVTETSADTKITGVSLRDKQKSKTIREQCGIKNISKCIKTRRKQLNQHVDRMGLARLPKICRDSKP